MLSVHASQICPSVHCFKFLICYAWPQVLIENHEFRCLACVPCASLTSSTVATARERDSFCFLSVRHSSSCSCSPVAERDLVFLPRPLSPVIRLLIFARYDDQERMPLLLPALLPCTLLGELRHIGISEIFQLLSLDSLPCFPFSKLAMSFCRVYGEKIGTWRFCKVTWVGRYRSPPTIFCSSSSSIPFYSSASSAKIEAVSG